MTPVRWSRTPPLVMNAMLDMSKIEIEGLRRAYESRETAAAAAAPSERA
jgi:hypothetical protein